ncbi:MAG: hypothetical protein D6757_05345 [Alphaproteobacteria bacterium]|nr:MAG: hypothetical protein D6757_05345 [Alphaproteobacteria bacterium]
MGAGAMKLRLQAESLIIRLDGDEARRLSQAGEIEERFFLPGADLRLQLRLIERDAPLRLEFSADTLRLSGTLGRARFATECARPSKNGIRGESGAGTFALQIDLKSARP